MGTVMFVPHSLMWNTSFQDIEPEPHVNPTQANIKEIATGPLSSK